jgi:transposase
MGLKTMVKNRIHHILDRNHVTLPPCSDIFAKTARQLLDQVSLPSPDNLLLKAHLELLDDIQSHVGDAEKWIKEALCQHPHIATIRTIPGFGKIFAPLIALEIDDIRRFSHPSKLYSYAGLVPSTYASGGKVRHGGLITSCNRWLRWAYEVDLTPFRKGLLDDLDQNCPPKSFQ